MSLVKHEFEITISSVNVPVMSVREVLEQSLARRAEEKDEDAIREMVGIILDKQGSEHPLAKVEDPTDLSYSLSIKRYNV
jgi:hypothetical protein